MQEQQRQAYLEAMGITSWVPKGVEVSEPKSVQPARVEGIAPVQPKANVAPVKPEPEIVVEKVDSASVPPDKLAHKAPSKEVPAQAISDSISEAPWLDDAPPCLEELSPTAEFDEEIDAPFEKEDDLSQLNWEQLEQRINQCERCDLHKTRTQSVFGVGHQTADLLVIGEAPGAEEDKQGKPFVGRAGTLLNAMLLAIGLKREQVFIANILKCRPPGNRDPRPEEATLCHGYLKRQVELVQPKAILAVGRIAAQNLLASQEPLGRLRGTQHSYNNIPLLVTYHPAYLLRSPDQKGKSWVDLQQALRLLS